MVDALQPRLTVIPLAETDSLSLRMLLKRELWLQSFTGCITESCCCLLCLFRLTDELLLQTGENSQKLYSSTNAAIARVIVAAGATPSLSGIQRKVNRMLDQDLGVACSIEGVEGSVTISFIGQQHLQQHASLNLIYRLHPLHNPDTNDSEGIRNRI